VGKLPAVGQPTRPTQPSIPFGSVMSSNPCIYMDCGGGDLYNGKVWLRMAV